MRPRQTLNPRHCLVNARVVLHGARTKRIHAQIDRVVPRRKPREMANHFHFAHFGKILDGIAHIGSAQRGNGIDSRNIELRQLITSLARRTPLENQPFVLREMTSYFSWNHALSTSASASMSSRSVISV